MKGIIQAGAHWQLGNGEAIRIWKDKWIPSLTSYQVQSPISTLDEFALVKELLSEDGKS